MHKLSTPLPPLAPLLSRLVPPPIPPLVEVHPCFADTCLRGDIFVNQKFLNFERKPKSENPIDENNRGLL